MGFSVGSYAKIKEVENKGNFSKGKITISKKVPNSTPAKYVCTFTGWVTFVGKAHQCRPMAEQRIKITNCDVNNGYLDRDGQQKFNNSPQYTIYEYELQDGGHSGGYMPTGYGATPSGFEELPFGEDSSLPF